MSGSEYSRREDTRCAAWHLSQISCPQGPHACWTRLSQDSPDLHYTASQGCDHHAGRAKATSACVADVLTLSAPGIAPRPVNSEVTCRRWRICSTRRMLGLECTIERDRQCIQSGPGGAAVGLPSTLGFALGFSLHGSSLAWARAVELCVCRREGGICAGCAVCHITLF